MTDPAMIRAAIQLQEINAGRVRHIIYMLCAIISTVALIIIAIKS